MSLTSLTQTSLVSKEEEFNCLLAEIPSDAPSWASALISLVKGLVVEIRTLNERVSEVCKLESLIAIQDNTSNRLSLENSRLNEEISSLRMQVDNNEQHDRNINLVLHGVPELQGENTTETFVKIISENLNLPLNKNEIARSHRLARHPSSYSDEQIKPRPIIVRFRDEIKKMEIYKAKKNLKGKPYTLTENLTKHRYQLYRKAVTVFGIKSVWSNEGRIFTNINGKYINIRTEQDLVQNS